MKEFSKISELDVFSRFTKSAKTAETAMKKIAKEAEKGINVKTVFDTSDYQKVSKELREKFRNVGTNIEFTGNLPELEKQYQRLSATFDRLTEKEQKIVSIGATSPESKVFKNLQYDLSATLNKMDMLSKKIESIKMPQTEIRINGLTQAEVQADTLKTAIQELPQIVSVSAQSMNYNANAMNAVFGEGAEKIQNWSQAINQFGQDAGAKLNDFTAKSDAATTKMQEFINSLNNLAIPPINETSLTKLQSSLSKTEVKLEDLRAKLENGITMGRITENVDDSGFVKLQEQIKLTELRAEALKGKIEELGSVKEPNFKFKNLSASIKDTGKSLQPLYNSLKRISDAATNMGEKIISAIAPTKKLDKSISGFNNSLSIGFAGIIKYGFGIETLFSLSGKIRSVIAEGFKSITLYSGEAGRNLSILTNSFELLKNSISAATLPIFNFFAPAINFLIEIVTKAVNVINQLFAALTGKSTWTRAKTGIDNYSAGIKEAEKETEELFSTTLSIDELNIIEPKSKSASSGMPDVGAGIKDAFEEVAIDEDILNFAKKIKDILSKLFAPLVEAWKRQGEFVMNSWKYALEEIWKLIKDIGRDFLIMWNQEETIKMFEDILIIIGDIGLVIGNLAHNFREAWNENQTGLHILENIRDIFAVIIHNVRLAADATVEWSKNIDFSPLLTKIEEWTSSLIPVFDNLSGIVRDFYEQVLLPLGKWTIEKGLPDLLQVFIDFNNKVDWESLKSRLSDFWDHLEPFAETVGEGLVLFIERISNALANFVNSEAFDSFLTSVENWMDNVSAEDVANALENIATSIIVLKGALLGFSAITALSETFKGVMAFISFFGSGGGAIGTAATMTETSAAIGALSTALGDLAAVGAGLGIVELLKDPIIDLGEAAGLSAQDADYLRERCNGLGGDLNLIKDPISILTNGFQGLGWEMSNALGASGALETAMNNISEGMIYTDEKLSKMKENFGLTDDDIEILRQSMLDMHPELRTIADTFEGLGGASVQTLEDIYGGFSVLSSTTGEYSSALDLMTSSQSSMTDEAKSFFRSMQEGADYFAYYQSAVENASKATGDFSDNIGKAGENIGKGVTEGFEKVDIEKPINSFYSKFKESLATAFDMHSPARNMFSDGENILLGIAEGFKSKFSEFSNLILSFFQSIQTVFESQNTQYLGEKLANGIIVGIQIKFQEIAEWLNSDFLSTGFEEGIMPWFSFEKWHDELLINIPLAFRTTWEELLAWWNEEAMLVWWEEYVIPWFEIERWQLQFTNILTALKTVWQQIVTMWNLLLDIWWNINVIPRFTLQRWTSMLIPVKTAFNNTFKEIVKIINERMEEAYHAVSEWCSQMISELEAVMAMISAVSSAVSSMGSIGVTAGINVGIRQYATGGFPPEDGWFRASKGEYFGQFDDGTSYIGTNKQIEYGVAVGVEEAAYRGMMRALQESGNASLLASIEENTRRAADREVVARIDPDRETVFALRSAEKRYGFQFT